MVINYPKFDYHASAERMDHSKLLIVITFGALRTCMQGESVGNG